MIDVGAVRLSCTLAGPEDGPLLILLHGFPEYGGSWRHFVAPLARAGFRVVVPDQRGYGRSDKPPRVRDYHIDALADDVEGLMRALGYPRAHVVGHDWGAAVAWWLAMRSPAKVERLVAMNVPHPAVMRSELLGNPKQTRRSWYMFYFQVPRLPEWSLLRDGGRRFYDNLASHAAPGSFPEEDREHYMRAWAQPNAMGSMLNWYRAAMRYQSTGDALARRVAVPTLVLWGKEDHALLSTMAAKSLDWCDEGSLRYFEGAGHFVQHDARVEVLEELLNFLPAPDAS